MTPIEMLHEHFIVERRVRMITKALSNVIPEGHHVLDVGCGDGFMARRLMDLRPDLNIEGVDILVRETSMIPMQEFDGDTLPYEDNSFDSAILTDVLHHTTAPEALLAETRRVVRNQIVIKDHLRKGVLALRTLTFMDRIGNERFGVQLPFNFLSTEEWKDTFRAAGLTLASWDEKIPLYPFPLSLAFNRHLHFVATLKC